MRVDVIGGLLGAGKTTTILRLLEEGGADGRTVLLVNEFGEVGVDGSLLAQAGGAVREITSGCICCSLRNDFIAQIKELAEVIEPARIIIEPSGVASLKEVVQALRSEELSGIVRDFRTILLVSAEDYDWFVELSPTFVDAQVDYAQMIVVNKQDLVPEETLDEVVRSLEARNPAAVVVPASFGGVDWTLIERLAVPVPDAEGASARLAEFEVYATELPETFNLDALRCVFDDFAEGRFGEVQRAKGVFDTTAGCTRIDLAGGRIHVADWPCHGPGRINVIGRSLDRAGIERAISKSVDSVLKPE